MSNLRFALPFLAACSSSVQTPPPSDAPRAADPTSTYVTARDGTPVAVDVWRPPGAGPWPTVLRMTRYWRGTAYLDPAARAGDRDEQLARTLVAAGFAVVVVDARGTGASFGTWTAPWSRAELDDDREVADWITRQPWANGAIATYGVSYDANSALLMGASGSPAIRASAPAFPDLDPYTSIAFPGGVANTGFLAAWDATNHALDANATCALATMAGRGCAEFAARVAGPRPVDPATLPAALEAHAANIDLARAFATATCRDDALGPGLPSLDELAPLHVAGALAAARVPQLVRVGWLDANTVAGALAAYHLVDTPQRLVIGATSHGGVTMADPFRDPTQPADPPIADQMTETFTFLGEAMAGAPVTKEIRYQTMGEGTWRTTATWPPPDTAERTLYAAAGGTLSDAPPAGASAGDTRPVDAGATTGARNRWLTPLDGGPISYPDRAAADASLLTYTSEPLATDLRITGDPRVSLYLSTTGPGAVFVYLEDVGPDGRVTYLTEGILDLAHRALAPPPYRGAPPAHSFRRADRQAVPANETMAIELALAPTSVMLRAGHRIRIAIAGADRDTFGPPTDPNVSFTVGRDASHPSRVVLPIAP
jgi:uncharacterized protein